MKNQKTPIKKQSTASINAHKQYHQQFNIIFSLVQNQQFPTAIKLATNLLQEAKLDLNSLSDLKLKVATINALALSYNNIGNIDKALFHYIENINLIDTYTTVDTKSQFEDIYTVSCCNVTTYFLDRMDSINAEKYLNKVPVSHRNEYYFENLSRLLLSQSQYEAAAKAAQKAINKNPKGIPGYYNKALALFNMGNYIEARAYFNKVLVLDPTEIDSQILLARIDTEEYQFKQATERLSKIPPSARNALFYRTLGLVYFKQENYKLAEIYLIKAIELNKPDIEYSIDLASIYLEQRNFEQFIKIYTELEQKNIHTPEFESLKFRYHIASGNIQEFSQSLQSLNQFDFNNKIILNFAIIIALANGKYNKVITLGQKALENSPRDLFTLRTISQAYLELGTFDKAYEFLQKAHSVYPEDSKLKIDFGDYYYKINDYKTAQRYYLEADSKYPAYNAELYNNIAHTYFATEDYDQSIEYLNKAINLHTSDPYFYFHLGLCYLFKGALLQAKSNFLEAIELYPPLLDVISPIFISKSKLKAIKQKSVQEEISVPEKTSKQEEISITEQTSVQAEDKQEQDTVQDELSIEEEWQKEIEKECQEIISRAKELTAAKKLEFKIYRANAVPTIKESLMNNQMGWGANYPKPTDEGVHKLTWKGLPKEKSKIYGFIDKNAPDIKKLDKKTLDKFEATLAKERIVNRTKNQDGVKLAKLEENPDSPSKLKILGTNGIGKRRLWSDKVTNKAGEELHIFRRYDPH